jgi:hypothetical protein
MHHCKAVTSLPTSSTKPRFFMARSITTAKSTQSERGTQTNPQLTVHLTTVVTNKKSHKQEKTQKANHSNLSKTTNCVINKSRKKMKSKSSSVQTKSWNLSTVMQQKSNANGDCTGSGNV